MNIKKYFILVFIAFSFFSVNFVDASCSLQSIKECDRAGLISLLKEIISYRQLNNKADLTKFKATEIVLNNLPDSIEFWTQAYCPNSGTKYDYEYNPNYFMESCEKGADGSHGGCKTCAMSKINLVKFYDCSVNSTNYYKFRNKELSIKTNYFSIDKNNTKQCNYCKVIINGNGINQTIESYCESSPSFGYDYNFDGFNDIAVRQIQAQNNSSDYYLYDEVKNKFVFNKKLSDLPNLEIVDEGKKILSAKYKGFGVWKFETYKYENEDLKLMELFLYDNDLSCLGECPIQYKFNDDGSNEIVFYEGFNVDERDGDGNTRLMRAFYSDSLKSAKDLIAAGANLDLKNNKNETAIEIARRNNSVSILKEWDSNIKTIETFYNYLKKSDYENAYKMYDDQADLGYTNFKNNYSQVKIYDSEFTSMNKGRYIFTIKHTCSDMVGDCLMYDVVVLIEEGKIVSIENN